MMNAQTAGPEAARLIELLSRQNELYRSLRALADRQRGLIGDPDARPLLSLLAERQRGVDELVRLNRSLEPFRAAWPSVYAGLEEASKARVTELIAANEQLLASILESDREDGATLSRRQAAVRSELGRTAGGVIAARAYGESAAVVCGLTDATA